MDEFDLALTEALNESVPTADFSTNLAERLVKRTRSRARFWKLLLALGLFSAATAAVITTSTLTTATTGVSPVGTSSTGTTGVPPVETTGDATDTSSTLHSSLLTLNSQQGDPQVQSTTLKKAAALMGATALAAVTPTRADGYQYIVSGYPAANPNHSDVSPGTSLAGGPLGDVSAAVALEARARTCDDSAGTALRSDLYKAMLILFK